jgi:hypothetical protein
MITAGKFFVDHEGKPFKRSSADPDDLKKYIEELLEKKEKASS